jgi:hypothetical protein
MKMVDSEKIPVDEMMNTMIELLAMSKDLNVSEQLRCIIKSELIELKQLIDITIAESELIELIGEKNLN